MLFLSTGFSAKNYGKESVSYAEQVYYQVLPFMFTALAITTMIRYKITIEYSFVNSHIPKMLKTFIWGSTSYLILACIILPAVSIDNNVSDLANRLINLFV